MTNFLHFDANLDKLTVSGHKPAGYTQGTDIGDILDAIEGDYCCTVTIEDAQSAAYALEDGEYLAGCNATIGTVERVYEFIEKIINAQNANSPEKYRTEGSSLYEYSADHGAFIHVYRNDAAQNGAELIEQYEQYLLDNQ